MTRTLRAVSVTLILGAAAVAAAMLAAPGVAPMPERAAEGEPAELPVDEAVLEIRSAPKSGELCVVRTCGRVDFVSAERGEVLRTLETGARAWAIRFRSRPGGAAEGGSRGSPESFVLAGIPISCRGGRVVAVNGESLVEADAEGGLRVLRTAAWLRGARLLSHAGHGSAVFVGLGDGRIARVEPGVQTVFSQAVPGPLTVLRTAGPVGPVFAGGVDRYWYLLRARDLEPLRVVPLRGSDPPVTAIAASQGMRIVVVAYGAGHPTLDAFAVTGRGLRSTGDAFGAKGPGALAVAIHPDRKVLAVGRIHGGLGFSFSGEGFHGGGNPGVPLRAASFFNGGTAVVWGWDDGSLAAYSYPEDRRLWGSPPDRRE
jgi:hypothetical protein